MEFRRLRGILISCCGQGRAHTSVFQGNVGKSAERQSDGVAHFPWMTRQATIKQCNLIRAEMANSVMKSRQILRIPPALHDKTKHVCPLPPPHQQLRKWLFPWWHQWWPTLAVMMHEFCELLIFVRPHPAGCCCCVRGGFIVNIAAV